MVADRVPGRSDDVGEPQETIYQALFVQGRGELRQRAGIAACARVVLIGGPVGSARDPEAGVPGMVNVSEHPSRSRKTEPCPATGKVT